METNKTEINIELSEDMAEGTYANLAIFSHSNAEFVIDFVSVMPNTPKCKVKSRIISTPIHAKKMMRALIDNIQKFEEKYGIIQEFENQDPPMNFVGPIAQA
ncbi:MAG: DUF3467 domain-containing protein [Alphaproteobacteria bacterium]|nr:DUF3467 domain-containing protein [Alphaproteobacteria bacterium]